MALGRENPNDAVPGLVTDGYNEQKQRGMYRRWAELMDAQRWNEIPPSEPSAGPATEEHDAMAGELAPEQRETLGSPC